MDIARDDELFGVCIKNHSGLKSYAEHVKAQNATDRGFMPFLLVMYGVTGAGKSHLAADFVSRIG